MGKVAVDKSVSLDGFITGPNPSPGIPLGEGGERIFAWMMAEAPGGEASSGMNAAWDELFSDAFRSTGAVVMSRKPFDIIANPDGWVAPDGTAFDWPVFVLTHEVQEPVTKGKTPFTFVNDGVESAFAKAREVARDKNIGLHGATVAQQFLKAGLVDEIHLHVVPVLLGGTRLFDQLGIDHIELEQTRMLETPSVTHLSYRTVRDS